MTQMLMKLGFRLKMKLKLTNGLKIFVILDYIWVKSRLCISFMNKTKKWNIFTNNKQWSQMMLFIMKKLVNSNN